MLSASEGTHLANADAAADGQSAVPPSEALLPSKWTTAKRVALLAAFPIAYVLLTFVLAIAPIAAALYIIFASPALWITLGLGAIALGSGWGAAKLVGATQIDGDIDRSDFIELSAADEPQFFAFIESLCERADTAPPDRIYAIAGVNAGVYIRSEGSVFLSRPERNLLIGVGLLNSLNRSELEAVLAHEFGHFSQRPLLLQHYVEIIDQILSRFGAEDKGWRRPVQPIFKVIGNALRRLDSKVSHDMELWADAVAVEIAGSAALVQALKSTDHGDRCYSQTCYDLERALAKGLRSDDLYFHHQVLIGETDGQPPVATTNPHQASDSHPAPATREAAARQARHDRPIDERPAWTLFADDNTLRQRLTHQFYAAIDAADAAKDLEPSTTQVQRHLDGEHAELLLAPADALVYGHRFMEPGELDLAISAADQLECDDGLLSLSLDDLTGPQFDEAMQRVAHHLEPRRQPATLPATRAFGDSAAPPQRRANSDDTDDHQWLAHWDRRLLIASLCAAKRTGDQAFEQLRHRYHFHLSLQKLLRWLRAHTPHIAHLHQALADDADDRPDSEDTGAEALRIALALQTQLSQGLEAMPALPDLHGLPAGQPLPMVVLNEPLLDAPDGADNSLSPQWLAAFGGQWQQLTTELDHLRRKSLGALLCYQRQIQAPWLTDTDRAA